MLAKRRNNYVKKYKFYSDYVTLFQSYLSQNLCNELILMPVASSWYFKTIINLQSLFYKIVKTDFIIEKKYTWLYAVIK